MTEFMQKWALVQPISVFVGKSDEVGTCPPLYSMIKAGSDRKYILISPIDPPVKMTYNGQTYHHFEYSEAAIGINVEDLVMEMYAVVLPLLINHSPVKMYTIVTDQWTVLDSGYNFLLPII